MNTERFHRRFLSRPGSGAFAGLLLSACLSLTFCCAAWAQPSACTQYWTCVQSQLVAQRNQGMAACSKAAAQHAVGGIGACESRIQLSQPAAQQACSSKGFTCRPVEMVLDYKVATLMYAPPGNSSSVQYGSGSTTGSTQGFTLTAGYSASSQSNSTSNIGLNGGSQGWGISFGLSSATGGSLGGGTSQATQYQMQIQKSISNTIGLQSKVDPITHGRDEFEIWFHPTMVITQTGLTNYGVQILPPAASAIVDLSVNELLGKEAVSSDKIAYFRMLTPLDIQSILALDPYVNPNLTVDPNRFVLTNAALQLVGPDNPGDNTTPSGLAIGSSTTVSTGPTETFNSTTGVSESSGASAGINLAGFLSLSENNVGTGGGTSNTQQTWTWAIANNSAASAGTSQSANLTLNTSTVGFRDLIDVYQDTVFGTFLYVSETNGTGIPANEPPTLTGLVLKGGVPLANQLIQVRLSNGAIRKVFTNSKGQYEVFRAVGPAEIIVGNQSVNQVLAMGKSISQNIQLP